LVYKTTMFYGVIKYKERQRRGQNLNKSPKQKIDRFKKKKFPQIM